MKKRNKITIDEGPVEGPPAPGRGRKQGESTNFYIGVAARAVKCAPEWIILKGYSTPSSASQMRKGRYPAIDPRDYEIEARVQEDGSYWVYLRYVGKIVEKN